MVNQQQSLDAVFHALSDPTRRAIVDRLGSGHLSASAIARPFDMSLVAVLHHLQVLEASGLVRTRKQGRVRICQLEQDALLTAETWFAERRAGWEGRLDRLGSVLDALDRDDPS